MNVVEYGLSDRVQNGKLVYASIAGLLSSILAIIGQMVDYSHTFAGDRYAYMETVRLVLALFALGGSCLGFLFAVAALLKWRIMLWIPITLIVLNALMLSLVILVFGGSVAF